MSLNFWWEWLISLGRHRACLSSLPYSNKVVKFTVYLSREAQREGEEARKEDTLIR